MQSLAAPNTHLQCGEDNGSVNDKVASGSPLPCDMRISGRAVRRVHGVGAALCGHGWRRFFFWKLCQEEAYFVR